MHACGADPEEFRAVEFYSSHEALLLDYERALTPLPLSFRRYKAGCLVSPVMVTVRWRVDLGAATAHGVAEIEQSSW
jgi:Class-II DAHP synthetase family